MQQRRFDSPLIWFNLFFKLRSCLHEDLQVFVIVEIFVNLCRMTKF
jgi:hypothetical protein